MQRPAGKDRGPPRHYEAATVEWRCRVTPAHAGQRLLAHVTIYSDGWAHWVEDGHAYTGYVQVGPCCDPPAVHALEADADGG
jgi:hypothetical protein